MLEPDLPLRPEQLEQEDENLLLKLDQFQSRFTKLQDHLGARLFAALLEALGEDAHSMSALDRTYRLEALGFLPDAEKWIAWRAIRNQLSHDYPGQTEELCAGFQLAFAAAKDLLGTWQHLLQKVLLHPILSQALSKDNVNA